MSDRLVMLTISRVEAENLDDLVAQFAELLAESTDASDPTDDPAVARLVPDAYRDDPDAADEFRRVTQSDLLGRRAEDAVRVRRDLALVTAESPHARADDLVDLALDEEGVRAWMRTLAAIRLVIASRLGIETEDDRDDDDPRFGVYDWLGYRLDGLIRAADE